MISLWSDSKSLFICLILLSLLGGCAMSADIEYKWEWPADRAIEKRVLIKVENIKAQSAGFFGVKKSPSLASSLPDPTVVTGINQGKDGSKGKTISIVVPKLEIENLKIGNYVVLGIVNSNTCICIVPVESPDVDILSVSCQ
jgi:hypothetical protein